MADGKGNKRLLFVDDEASIRLTLPPILERAGFDVHVAESVSDALFEINSFQFDALLTDLNIGEEGDGFLVASGMRHIQPNCAIFILTGYPAFETALQAIHSQVDDYLVKPVEVDALVGTLRSKIEKSGAKPLSKRIPVLLKENSAEINAKIAELLKGDAKRGSNSVDETKIYLGKLVNGVVDAMTHDEETLKPETLRAASEYGKWSAKSGNSASTIVRDFRAVEDAIYGTIQRSLAVTELLPLVSDLRKLTLGLNSLMEQALESFSGSAKKTAQA